MCTTSEPKQQQSGQAVGSKEDGDRTKIFTPFLKRHPLVARGHVKQVSDDRKALGPWRERVIATFLASGEVHDDYQEEAKNDDRKLGGKAQRHFRGGEGNSEVAHRDIEERSSLKHSDMAVDVTGSSMGSNLAKRGIGHRSVLMGVAA